MLFIALVVLFFHARSFLPFFADDALISLRYAKRLLAGLGLTWTDGERVEGYSNLLWVLACAGLGRCGVDLILGARILGFLGMGAALGAVVYAHAPDRATRLLPPLAGALVLALAGPVACWAIGGLEQGLLAGLLAWALVLSYPLLEEESPGWKKALAPGLLLGLLAITRPDGLLFTIAIAAGLLDQRWRRRETWRLVAMLTAISGAFFLAQLAFRLAYYHEWLPNTAYVKLSLSNARLRSGLYYALNASRPNTWLILSVALGAFVCRNDPLARRRVLLLLTTLIFWVIYIIFIGGDIFPAYRHFIPALVCLALVTSVIADSVLRRLRQPASRLLAWIAVGALLGVTLRGQLTDTVIHNARLERWEWDGKLFGEMLKRTFGARRPLLAVDPAGCLPYFSDLPSLDMLGLNDHHIARSRRKDPHASMLGHDMGDGLYVLGRRPDLVIFNGARGEYYPVLPSGCEMSFAPEFINNYKAVTFEVSPTVDWHGVVFMRVEGGPLGIERTPDRVSVPGYLIMDNRQRSIIGYHVKRSLVIFDEQGRPMVEIIPTHPAQFKGLALAPGTWRVEADSTAMPGQPLLLESEGRLMPLGPGAPRPLLAVSAAKARVDFTLKSPQGRIGVRSLSFQKVR